MLARNGSHFRRLEFYCGIDESESRTTQSFVFAKDQREVTANLHIGKRHGGEHVGANILDYVGTGDEAHTDVGRNEAFQ